MEKRRQMGIEMIVSKIDGAAANHYVYM